MKTHNINILLLALLYFCISCNETENGPPVETGPEEPPKVYDYAIYFLADSNLKIEDITSPELVQQDSSELASLEIQREPWISSKDIHMYDFSSHMMYLHGIRDDFIPGGDPFDVPGSWYYRPFVVVADGQKRYVGYMEGSFSSALWPFPKIIPSFNYFYPQDLLTITWGWFNNPSDDNRYDSTVKESLKKAGILHDGLQLRLNEIHAIDNTDTASVTYTFTLINQDEDNLYVLDPDKTGIEIFQHYNTGLQLLKSDENRVRTAYLTPSLSPGNWKPEWFCKLKSGDSITRTVSAEGYEKFKSGQYACAAYYRSYKKIPKEQRTTSDGRYWIGPTESNIMVIEFEE